MDLNLLALFAFTELLLSIAPGPAVLLVIGLSMRNGFRVGFMAIMGILATNAVFFSLSALGIGALIIASSTLFTFVKWIGAGYLIYLGIGLIFPLVKRLRENRGNTEPEFPTAAQQAPLPLQSEVKSFWQGFTLQASNPKNIAFFVAILPQFVSPDGNVALQLVLLGVVSVFVELPVLVFYALAASYSAKFLGERVIQWIEAAGGAMLIGIGTTLAVSDRPSI